jgi:c(7)-type cytochrome triheme protein
MRNLLSLLAAVCLLAACHSAQNADEKKSTAPEPQPQAHFADGAQPGDPPETILIPSKYGDVTYTHKKHLDRVNGDCAMCHTKLFPQALAPLNYKKALHRVAEADRTSCASCHAIGGSAFAADSNCIRCHAEKDYSKH